MTDVEETYHFDIDLVTNDQLVYRAAPPQILIGNHLQIADFGINIPALVFPAPGRYEFRLRMDGHVIARKNSMSFSYRRRSTTRTSALPRIRFGVRLFD